MSMLSPGGKVPKKRRPFNGTPSGLGKRVLGVFVVLLLLVGSGAAAWWFGIRSSPPSGATACTTSSPLAASVKPAGPPAVGAARVTLNVYNATSRSGLATTVATELKTRRFTIAKVANDPMHRTVAGTAEVRVGPHGRGAAVTVLAQVPRAVLVIDKRIDSTVDLVIGAQYADLRTPAEVSAVLRAASKSVRAAPVTTPTSKACA